MSVMAFDTLRFAKTPREAGLPDPQAEAIAGGFGEALREHAVTKADLDLLEARLGGRIGGVEAQLDGRIDRIETMLRYLIGAVTALLVAMLVAFIRGFGGA